VASRITQATIDASVVRTDDRQSLVLVSTTSRETRDVIGVDHAIDTCEVEHMSRRH
jgi:hypothetical protein